MRKEKNTPKVCGCCQWSRLSEFFLRKKKKKSNAMLHILARILSVRRRSMSSDIRARFASFPVAVSPSLRPRLPTTCCSVRSSRPTFVRGILPRGRGRPLSSDLVPGPPLAHSSLPLSIVVDTPGEISVRAPSPRTSVPCFSVYTRRFSNA